MAGTCLDNKLLAYGGTSQSQRLLNALNAIYAQADERAAADLILFAKKYAAYLNYYDATDSVNGDWQPFMNNDAAVIIAGVADWRTKDFILYVDYVTSTLQTANDSNAAQNLFKTLFDLVFTLVTNLDNAENKLTNDIPFKDYLNLAIASNLALPFNALWQYYNDFITSSTNIINEGTDYADALMPVDNILYSEHFNPVNLSSASWQLVSFTAPGITIDTTADIISNINTITTHNLFTGALQSFINGVIKIVSNAPSYLNDVLENYALHQPHYALYLTFLRLFQFAQKKLNNYTQEHLDFYYKDVLRLTNAAAEPDFVHLLFELQKNTNDHILEKGTAFKAGKDASNNDLFYTLTDDVVLHQASVQTLKSLYLNKTGGGVLYASPIANSEDGNGAKLQSADKSWYTFGDSSKTKANIGFALASNILYLNEGERTIDITFQCENISGVTIADLSGIFSVQLTGKKNWYTVPSYTPSVSGNSFTLEVKIDGNAPPIIPYSQKIHGGNFTELLPMVQVLLTNYTSYQKIKSLVIKSIALKVNATVKNLSLQNDDGKINAAKPFKIFGEFPESGASFIIGSKEIFQKPLTELVIIISWQLLPVWGSLISVMALNEGAWTSELDDAFQLRTVNIIIQKNVSNFGSSASLESGLSSNLFSSFESGSVSEFSAASKFSASSKFSDASKLSPLSKFSKDLKSSSSLESGSISASASSAIALIVNTNTTIQGLEKIPVAETDFTPTEDYNTTSTESFIKLQLNSSDYSLSTYLSAVQDSIKNTSTNITSKDNGDGSTTTTYTVKPPGTVPLPPSPVVQSIAINYTAQETINFGETAGDFAKRTNFYYHIEPFGFREMHPLITSDALSFLPVFNADDNIPADNGGELWLGLNKANALETFSILFQVADGTANPLQQITTINWYYLSNNNWINFKKADVTDGTNYLTRSGIVLFNIPADATTANTRADNGLLWLKAAADHNTDAVCKLIAVTANAAKATFLQDTSKNIVFTKSLASNIISKAAAADAALKKINQPYSSFDGRISETDDRFYVRVSERLKHKHRAVTAWDYERLVLQNYPQIHKVKCISHTGIITDNSNNKKYSETLPGHVTIVTIPDLMNNTAANTLRPYTSIGLLTEIQNYLQQLNSPFVVSNLNNQQLNRLHVINPQFEEVQFEFSVVFMPNYDATAFSNQLNTDVEQFLTPWAFSSQTDIEFGNTIEKSVVLNFIEEREYVDYVTCFTMNQIIGRDSLTTQKLLPDVEVAVASTARSILVSYNDGINRHIIHSQSNCDCNA